MNISSLKKLIADNSPGILTGISVAGTILTSVLTAKATWSAAEKIKFEENFYGAPQEGWPLVKSRVRRAWVYYIPAVVTGTITIVCVVAADRIGNRRAAAIAAAYSLSEKAFGEYREKVVQQVGKQKEQRVRDEIAQDRVGASQVQHSQVIVTGNGDVLCFDTLTGRYFESNVEAIRRAENDLNFQLIHENYASLSDFYRLVGLPPTTFSEEVGWTSQKKVEIYISAVMAENDRPCLAITFRVEPVRDYYKIG
jgi:hypothetical protein